MLLRRFAAKLLTVECVEQDGWSNQDPRFLGTQIYPG